MDHVASIVSSRPDWCRGVSGIPCDVVVRVCGDKQGRPQGRPMIQVTTKRVSLVKGDSGRAKPEDEYDVNFVYGPEASNADVAKRHLEPLVKKVIEGYNATVLCFGATGSGKTTSLEGMRRDGKATSEGDGAVHLVCDALFRLLNDKAVHVGDRVAVSQGARAKSYDFFVEASFVEVANEECHDLLQKGGATRANLPLYEDDLDGYQLSGLTYRMAKASTELRQSFNYGRLMRDFSEPDVGSVHERSAGVFTIYLAQYSPALAMGQEDSVMASRLTIVDMPGAERLAVEPELLRLREGATLNKSLLGYASTIGTLARDGSSQFVNYDECVLTRLLADALGGNSLALVMGCLRQGDWEGSVTTLQHLQLARKVRNFPIINHGRARGLLQSIRRRLLSLMDDRNTLREQLDEVPADGDPNAVAVSIARLRDIEAQLIAERNEKAAMGEEKHALAARLRRLQDAESGDLQERAELHEALIKSEEMRLELAKNLIAAQVDMNEKEREYADEKLELEKKIVELEAIKVSDYVKSDDAAALEQQRDQLNTELLDTQDELVRREKEVEELKRAIGEQQEELRKLHNDLNLIGGEGDAKDWDFTDADAEDADGDSVEARRRKLFMQLKVKTRQIEELRSAMKDLQKETDKLRNKRNLTQAGVDEMREAYRRKLESHMRDIGDMSRAVAIMQDDPKTGLRVSPEDLFKAFQKLTDENVEVTAQREADLREDLDDLHGRHVELKRKFRTLYLAYRDLRYLVEDKWPNPGVPPRPDVPHEDSVLEAAFDDLTRSEEEADRRLVARLRERTSHLDAQLAAIKLSQAAGEKGIKLRPTDYSSAARAEGAAGSFVDNPTARFENEKMREELERMKKIVGSGPGGAANERLLNENATLVNQLKNLSGDKGRAQMAAELARAQTELQALRRGGGGGGAGFEDASAVHAAVKDFSNKTQAELERKLAHADARRVMAEEQLEGMQKYLTKSTMQYQREIVRLRSVIGQLDPRMLKSNPLKGTR